MANKKYYHLAQAGAVDSILSEGLRAYHSPELEKNVVYLATGPRRSIGRLLQEDLGDTGEPPVLLEVKVPRSISLRKDPWGATVYGSWYAEEDIPSSAVRVVQVLKPNILEYEVERLSDAFSEGKLKRLVRKYLDKETEHLTTRFGISSSESRKIIHKAYGLFRGHSRERSRKYFYQRKSKTSES